VSGGDGAPPDGEPPAGEPPDGALPDGDGLLFVPTAQSRFACGRLDALVRRGREKQDFCLSLLMTGLADSAS
jgi:hypothetical protein